MDDQAVQQLRKEAGIDARRLSIALARVHRRMHPFTRIGWNRCEKEPCHSAGVVLGDLAILSMELDRDPRDVA